MRPADRSLLLPLFVALVSPARANEPVDFVRDIRPLFEKRCFSCHGPKKQEGGLRLDVRRRAQSGGDSGPTFVPGQGTRGELLRRLTADDPEQRMPPSGRPLTADEIARVRAWIDQGAAWPDALAGKEVFEDHWAFRPLRAPVPPPVRDAAWVRGPLDCFVLARLERQGVHPSPEAERTTLIRRLSLDLLGLPPTPAEVEGFLADDRPDAYSRLVERLLASPHHGERWGRHWLDLARFAESDGYENDRIRPDAWRWRDWVIADVNHDMPFDQFTIEQLAGDLLPNATPDQKLATGFHRNTLWNSAASADKEEFRTRAIKDRAETTATAWLGLTLGCAQCHSHKYDPIAQQEYYRLYAFFNNTDNEDMPVPGGKALVLKAVARTTHVHRRGVFLNPGAEVTPGTPAFLPPLRPRGPQADRLDLARWLVSPENPLTARVAVNRIWQHLFGAGLVPTPENFGLNGQPPTQPELLDWLASEFVRRGWSAKDLIRIIVHSATYRQVSHYRPALAGADPGNALLARQNRYRVEAEVVRDQALAAAGLLSRAVGGPSVVPPFPRELPTGQFSSEALKGPGGDRHRRSVYIHVQRTLTHPVMATFDMADGNQCCPRRDRSCTPLQALTLLNDPTFAECASALGSRLRQAGSDDSARVGLGFRLCLARAPDAAEVTVLTGLLDEQRRRGAAEEAAWAGVARALLNLEEFLTRE